MPYENVIKIGLVLAILLGIGYAINHYGNLREQALIADELQEDNEKLVKEKKETKRQIGLNEDEKKAFEEMIAKATQEKEADDKIILEHDLDRLLQEKPGLIINRINVGTDRLFEDISEIYSD